MNDPIEQLRRLVEVRAKATAGPWINEMMDSDFRDGQYITGHVTAKAHDYCGNSRGRKDSVTSPDSMTCDDGDFIALAGSLDLPALLAAWEADRAKIENAWHELRNLLDRNMPQDSLASAIAYMIDHSNTGWQRVCGWEKLGKAKDALLDEKDDRIAKLEAVVETIWSKCKVVYWPANGEYPIEHNLTACKDSRSSIEAALEGDQQ